jgi:Flp pilus assembly protein TadG
MGRKSLREKGQSLVEFALVVWILLFLVIGIAEFGRAWMTRNILVGAAREAVRIAAVTGNQAAAEARAEEILSSAAIDGANVSTFDDGVAYGTYSVTVTYVFPTVIAGFIPGLDGITLATTTSMRKEY